MDGLNDPDLSQWPQAPMYSYNILSVPRLMVAQGIRIYWSCLSIPSRHHFSIKRQLWKTLNNWLFFFWYLPPPLVTYKPLSITHTHNNHSRCSVIWFLLLECIFFKIELALIKYDVTTKQKENYKILSFEFKYTLRKTIT